MTDIKTQIIEPTPDQISEANRLVTRYGPIRALEIAREQHGLLNSAQNTAICNAATQAITAGQNIKIEKPKKNAFRLARMMVAEIGKADYQATREYVKIQGKLAYEHECRLTLPGELTEDKPSFYVAQTLLETAINAAKQEGTCPTKAEVMTNANGVIIKRYEYEQSAPFPTKTVLATLEAVQKSLGNGWEKDTAGKWRHGTTFQKYLPYGLATQHFSMSALQDYSGNNELYLPDKNADPNNLMALTPKENGRTGIGLCLTTDQVNQLARVVGFESPVRSK